MTTAELREATREFDSADYQPKFLKPTATERAQLDTFRRRLRGAPRSRARQTAKRVVVTLEADLLKSADAFARRKRISRSDLIARGLKLAIRRAG